MYPGAWQIQLLMPSDDANRIRRGRAPALECAPEYVRLVKMKKKLQPPLDGEGGWRVERWRKKKKEGVGWGGRGGGGGRGTLQVRCTLSLAFPDNAG